MSDSYQAIFDAVRSKIGNVDAGEAIERSFRDMNIAHYFEMASAEARMAICSIQEEMTAPSAVYRPSISVDGNQWCALYGDDLQSGVAGFGDTPEQAMADFNKNWREPLRNSPSGLAKSV
ncbi:hypothetical protein [Pseudomonas segetis]|uniref:Uncharacterized protein n=1 Tax=Pseudomonas segetis TaxID=298908 RepID=A0A239C876_9PSED|nr:hypothetical protein [Pseudomonas segetis]SNS16436.1 hypothetical protein SAMN05216255_1566 [Pseudomonas segetis]